MSELYSIDVLSRPNPTTVKLLVSVVHPDSMHISGTPGFALMLLQECNQSESLLAKEVDFDSVLDASWLQQYAQGFVSKVTLEDLENIPPEEARFDSSHPYYENSSQWLNGTMIVEVTDPAWVGHVKEGDSWGSASFEPCSTFDDCEPIHPAKEEEGGLSLSVEDSKGFLPIPEYFFEHTMGFLTGPVWIPIYGDSAYKAVDTIKGKDITDEKLEAWIGKPVFFQDTYTDGLGVLVSTTSVFTISSGSYGSNGISAKSLKSISLAAFDTSKKRLNDPLSYGKILDWIDPVVSAVAVDGKKATFTIETFGSGQKAKLESASDAMVLISRSLVDSFDDFKDEEVKLSQMLLREKEERDIYFLGEVFTKIANGIVVKSSVKQLNKDTQPNWEGLDNQQIIAEIAKSPWATWSVTIEVTDSAWIEHLPASVPYKNSFSWNETAEPWEGEPIVWEG